MNGTSPPKNVPTTGISCDNIPAATPKASGEGKPIIKKDKDDIYFTFLNNGLDISCS